MNTALLDAVTAELSNPTLRDAFRDELIRRLRDGDVAITDISRIYCENQSDDEKRYVDAAQSAFSEEDHAFDDASMVSEGDDGAYVAAWVWVPACDAGIVFRLNEVDESLEQEDISREDATALAEELIAVAAVNLTYQVATEEGGFDFDHQETISKSALRMDLLKGLPVCRVIDSGNGRRYLGVFASENDGDDGEWRLFELEATHEEVPA